MRGALFLTMGSASSSDCKGFSLDCLASLPVSSSASKAQETLGQLTSHGSLIHPIRNPPWAVGKSEVASGEKAMFMWCTNSGISGTVFREGGLGPTLLARLLELYNKATRSESTKEMKGFTGVSGAQGARPPALTQEPLATCICLT